MTGDVLKCLARLPDESVQCVVTSPPYWALRDYGTATWAGGAADCDHLGPPVRTQAGFNARYFGKEFKTDKQGEEREPMGQICGKCGARRIDRQIGLEGTPDAYVAKMVAVFREVKRVLRPDGTCWVNLGDSYASGKVGNTNGLDASTLTTGTRIERRIEVERAKGESVTRGVPPGLKPKDLVGIPWRVAFALQADGWYLRSDIIWHKPNPMPESVRDRPTKSHEYVFLLTKRGRYFYDADAVREKAECGRRGWKDEHFKNGDLRIHHKGTTTGSDPSAGRNLRSVWTITPKPFRGAHFATFAPQLVERCVKAGSSERGACPTCGAPWERVTVYKGAPRNGYHNEERENAIHAGGGKHKGIASGPQLAAWRELNPARHLGWRPTCSCPAAEPVPCVVLDPFSGAGTVALVCKQLGRDAIGIDLNLSYNRMARKRIAESCPLTPA